ncbi:MAG: 30S ribosome-binding factor RbfA [Spirochaetaceae bacterium]|nr:30S ribosome-binding factor RbfA [Spirochaetaceae bacterium]
MSDTFRLQRIRNLIQEEIGKMILMDVIKDPRISNLISVSEVSVSKDIKYAKVYISGFESTKSVNNSVEALNHAAGFIQMKLAKRLKTRNTPKLSFFTDSSIENGIEMIKKIEEINS